jgi:hypothetical protein
MAVAAVFGSRESFRVDELSRVGGGKGREKGLIGAKAVVVVLGYGLAVYLSLSDCGIVIFRMGPPSFQGQNATSR